MGKITEIKFNKEYTKAKVYVDGEYFNELTGEAIIMRGLKVGADIDVDILNVATHDSQIRLAFDWLVGYLSNYPSSKKRCYKKLMEKGYPPCVIEIAIAKAEEYKYIDDGQLSAQLATAYLSKGSVRQARDKMLDMDLPLALINKALQELGQDAEYQSAVQVTASWAKYKDLDDRATKDKYFRYMSGKGYSFAIAKSALLQVKEEEHEE